MQDSFHKTDVLPSLCSDHSPILFSLDMIKEGQRRKGLWKFNSSLSSNKRFVRNMKNHIATTIIFLNEENIFDDQIRWEYLKYEIRKFSIHFSVSEAKKINNEMKTLENKIKTVEENLTNNENNEEYLKCKRDLNYIYDQKIEGIKIRSKCNWYEDGEKSSKVFLNL